MFGIIRGDPVATRIGDLLGVVSCHAQPGRSSAPTYLLMTKSLVARHFEGSKIDWLMKLFAVQLPLCYKSIHSIHTIIILELWCNQRGFYEQIITFSR